MITEVNGCQVRIMFGMLPGARAKKKDTSHRQQKDEDAGQADLIRHDQIHIGDIGVDVDFGCSGKADADQGVTTD